MADISVTSAIVTPASNMTTNFTQTNSTGSILSETLYPDELSHTEN